MSIENVGSMNKILKNYQSTDWLKNADLEISKNSPSIDELGGAKKEQNFSEFLINSIKDVNDLQLHANNSIEKLATGNKTNIHETMLAVEQADIAFKAMNQIRQKVLDAYKEVMRMQI